MGRSQTRRWSTVTALVGVVLLWAACAAMVLVPLGVTESSTSRPDGTWVTRTERTSLWESQHTAAVGIVQVVLVFSVVAFLLIRFGGIVGAFVVGLCCALGLLASMMSVGVFLLPGATCLGVASVLSIADRFERRAQRRFERRFERRFGAPGHPVAPA